MNAPQSNEKRPQTPNSVSSQRQKQLARTSRTRSWQSFKGLLGVGVALPAQRCLTVESELRRSTRATNRWPREAYSTILRITIITIFLSSFVSFPRFNSSSNDNHSEYKTIQCHAVQCGTTLSMLITTVPCNVSSVSLFRLFFSLSLSFSFILLVLENMMAFAMDVCNGVNANAHGAVHGSAQLVILHGTVLCAQHYVSLALEP